MTSVQPHFCTSATDRNKIVGEQNSAQLLDADVEYYKIRVKHQLSVLNHLIKIYKMENDASIKAFMRLIDAAIPEDINLNRNHKKLSRFSDYISSAVLVLSMNSERFTYEKKLEIREANKDVINFCLNIPPRFFEQTLINS